MSSFENRLIATRVHVCSVCSELGFPRRHIAYLTFRKESGLKLKIHRGEVEKRMVGLTPHLLLQEEKSLDNIVLYCSIIGCNFKLEKKTSNTPYAWKVVQINHRDSNREEIVIPKDGKIFKGIIEYDDPTYRLGDAPYHGRDVQGIIDGQERIFDDYFRKKLGI